MSIAVAAGSGVPARVPAWTVVSIPCPLVLEVRSVASTSVSDVSAWQAAPIRFAHLVPTNAAHVVRSAFWGGPPAYLRNSRLMLFRSVDCVYRRTTRMTFCAGGSAGIPEHPQFYRNCDTHLRIFRGPSPKGPERGTAALLPAVSRPVRSSCLIELLDACVDLARSDHEVELAVLVLCRPEPTPMVALHPQVVRPDVDGLRPPAESSTGREGFVFHELDFDETRKPVKRGKQEKVAICGNFLSVRQPLTNGNHSPARPTDGRRGRPRARRPQ